MHFASHMLRREKADTEKRFEMPLDQRLERLLDRNGRAFKFFNGAIAGVEELDIAHIAALLYFVLSLITTLSYPRRILSGRNASVRRADASG